MDGPVAINDWIDLLGGGLSAVVIFALGYVCWRLWDRVQSLQDQHVEEIKANAERRLNDHKEHSAQVSENIATLNKAMDLLQSGGG